MGAALQSRAPRRRVNRTPGSSIAQQLRRMIEGWGTSDCCQYWAVHSERTGPYEGTRARPGSA
eukprot:3829303-Rhodomonas_salina.2